MVAGHERLIVVLGMAHSGTTILTYVLKQHPDVILAAGGHDAWLLENRWMVWEEAEPIQDLLATNPNKCVLLKRPWNEVHHAEWMKQEMPGAKYIYCHRDFDDIAKSWSKSSSLVDSRLRHAGVCYERLFYRMCLAKALKFSREMRFFHKIPNTSFIEHPKQTMAAITAWCGLEPFEFDVSQVSADSNIKRLLDPKRLGGSRQI